MLLDPQTFSRAHGPGPMPGGPTNPPALPATDPPLHDQLRALVNRALTPRRVAAAAPRVEALARELLDEPTKGEIGRPHYVARTSLDALSLLAPPPGQVASPSCRIPAIAGSLESGVPSLGLLFGLPSPEPTGSHRTESARRSLRDCRVGPPDAVGSLARCSLEARLPPANALQPGQSCDTRYELDECQRLGHSDQLGEDPCV